jgi:clan AA aspartic protease (TIGR02281 family)
MKSWMTLISLMLCLSLGLNLFLLFGDSSFNLELPSDSSVQQNNAAPQNESPIASQALSENYRTNKSSHKDSELGEMDNLVTGVVEDRDTADRSTIFITANQMYANKNYLELGLLLQNYLKQHPQDIEFLLLEAKMKVETSLLSDAIGHYYDLLRKPMTLAQQQEVEEQINTLSSNSIEQLTRLYSWEVLAMFVEPLLQLDPNNRLYILSLAKAYAELYQEALMENVLGSLPFDDPGAKAIRQIIVAQQLPEPNGESSEDTVEPIVGRAIALQKYADQYVIDGLLSSNPVSLLIDTGASVTAISRRYFNRLSNRYKVNYLGRFSIGTAAGSIKASMYQFRELRIGHVKVENLPVVILPMGQFENADGLLGMNFLREFDFKIDQRQSVMFIK